MNTETRNTKTMKAIQLWIMVLVLTLSSSAVLTSCTKDDPVYPRPEPQPVILKGEAAVEWTKNHLDSLVNVYMAASARSIRRINTTLSISQPASL